MVDNKYMTNNKVMIIVRDHLIHNDAEIIIALEHNI